MQYPVDMEAFAANIQRAKTFIDRVHPKSSERPVYGKRVYEAESSDEEEEEEKRDEDSSEEDSSDEETDQASESSSEESDGESNDDDSEGSTSSSGFIAANGKGRKLLTPEQLKNSKAIKSDSSDSGHDDIDMEAMDDQFDVLNCSFSFRNFDNIRTSDDAVISGLIPHLNEIIDEDSTGYLDNILNNILQTDHQFADFTEQPIDDMLCDLPDEGLGEPMDQDQIECELVACDDDAFYGFWILKIVIVISL